MNKPYLGSTPDGLVGEDIVIEVKCPYVARYKQITPKTVSYLISVDGKLKLDSKHNYYAQVQGQMYITNRKMCHFVVYTLVPKTEIIEVPYDEEFVNDMLSSLDQFYLDYFKPALLQKHFYKM